MPHLSNGPSERSAVTWVVVAFSAAGLASTLLAYVLDDGPQLWAANLGWLAVALAAVAGIGQARARSLPDSRTAWTFLLAGALCWAGGEALWVLWLVTPPAASPNVADAGWYAFAVLSAAGLIRLGRGRQPSRWLASIEILPLIGAVCAIVAALVWSTAAESPLDDPAMIATLAYPALYVSAALVVLQTVTTGGLPVRGNPGVAALVAGVIVEAIGFILWCPPLLEGTYVAGSHVCDIFFSVGLALMAVGASFAREVPERTRTRRRLGAALPGLTFVVLVAVQLRFIIIDADTWPRFTLALAVALMGGMLLLRAAVLHREQAVLLEREQRAFADAADARKELDRFFTLSIAMLAVADFDGCFRRLNPAWTDVLGWSLDDLLGKPFLEFVHPDDVAPTLRVMEALDDGVETLHFENRYRCKDGSYRWLSWKSRPDLDAGMIYASAHDVTDRMAMAAELETARDLALEASRQKSEFLAMMSHEIRTPLNGVLGMTTLLAATDLDEEQRGYADTVGSSGEALLTIINDILDFSKIEAGRLGLDPVDFVVREMVEEVAEQLAGHAHDKGLELAVVVGDEVPPMVNGDPTRVRQILTNLVGNAVKFTASGEVIVSVSTQRGEHGDLDLRFDVRDTGIGIDQDEIPRLFDSFTQADASTTRRFGGSGLGLAISRRLVERMDGAIGASSALGVGSTFWCVIRVGDVRTGVQAKPRLDLAGVRVLVVDDNATNREILEHQLRTSRMRPETAPDGASALRRMRSAVRRGEPHELLLLDFNMPGIDGVEVAQQVSDDPELAGVPMILLTSSGGLSEAGRCAGIDGFLTKPVRQSRLLDAMARALGSGIEEAVKPVTEPSPVAGGAGLRVLVAEDNEVNQAVAKITLRKRGVEVDIASNGLEAVERAGAGGYLAIFMDCQMPELDGYDATREIRRREGGTGHVPIIAMTASAMLGDRDRCLAAGMDDYLTKPLRLGELDRVLDAWVRSVPPADGEETESVIDSGTLAQLRATVGDDELMADLIELFCTDAASRIDEIEEAIAAERPDDVMRAAHTLKGSSANLGATGVMRLAERVEQHAQEGGPAEAHVLVGLLSDELARATVTLRGKSAASA